MYNLEKRIKVKKIYKQQLGWLRKNIEEYDEAKNLNLIDWFYQLLFRKTISNAINSNEIEKANKWMEMIKEHAIVSDAIFRCSSYKCFMVEPTKLGSSSVNSLSRYEAYKFCEILEIDMGEKKLNEKYGFKTFNTKNSIINNTEVDKEKFPKEVRDFWGFMPFDDYVKEKKQESRHPYNPNWYVDLLHVTVNLSASDSEIKRDFDDWLKEVRRSLMPENSKGKKRIIQGKFSNKTFKDWTRCRLLAYIDLKLLWMKLNDVELSEEDIAEIIYPCGSEGGRQKIVDTVRPLANQMMDYNNLRKLHKFALRI